MIKMDAIKERGRYDINFSSVEKEEERDLLSVIFDTKCNTFDIVFDDNIVANNESRTSFEIANGIVDSVAVNRKEKALHGEIKTYSKEIIDKFLAKSGIVPISEEENRIIEMHNEQLVAYNQSSEDSYYAFK